MILSFHDYLPLNDLVQIAVAALVVAVIAPSAVSVAIAGLDKRTSGETGMGGAMIAAGALVLAVLVLIGLYTLVER
jgi:hypothetical protein